MSRPKVSVVIPCYNHAAFIAEAIESVLNQTYREFELLVADNGSTDNSREIIERYSDQIEIIRLDENNVEKCYDIFFEKIQGEYIALLSSDDVWYPEKLEEQMKAIEEHPNCDIFFTWSMVMDKNFEKMIGGDRFIKKNATRAEWIRRLLLEGATLEASSILYKNDNRIIQGYFKKSVAFKQMPDCKQYMDMVLEEEIYVVEKVLVKHRMHGNNISALNPEKTIAVMNERAFVFYDVWNRISDELFEEAFFENKDNQLSHAEVVSHKILLFLKIAEQMECMGSMALAFMWQHIMDEGVREILEEKYDFTIENVFECARKMGEAKEWYANTHQKEVVEQTECESQTIEESEKPLVNILKHFIRCNEKVLSCYANGQLREELIDVVQVVIDGLHRIQLSDEVVNNCEESLAIVKKDKLDNEMWMNMVHAVEALQERLELYLKRAEGKM